VNDDNFSNHYENPPPKFPLTGEIFPFESNRDFHNRNFVSERIRDWNFLIYFKLTDYPGKRFRAAGFSIPAGEVLNLRNA
jgi:hypothetical protein